jgi:hypothetical protein
MQAHNLLVLPNIHCPHIVRSGHRVYTGVATPDHHPSLESSLLCQSTPRCRISILVSPVFMTRRLLLRLLCAVRQQQLAKLAAELQQQQYCGLHLDGAACVHAATCSQSLCRGSCGHSRVHFGENCNSMQSHCHSSAATGLGSSGSSSSCGSGSMRGLRVHSFKHGGHSLLLTQHGQQQIPWQRYRSAS